MGNYSFDILLTILNYRSTVCIVNTLFKQVMNYMLVLTLKNEDFKGNVARLRRF